MVVIASSWSGVAISARRLRMNLQGAVLVAALVATVSVSLGGTEHNVLHALHRRPLILFTAEGKRIGEK